MKTVAQLKIGTTGMFVGRTTTDSKFESKVGSEIMYIAYRKPVWDWSVEGQLQQAEQYQINQRLRDGEMTPMLPPDTLFGPNWVEIQTYGERKQPNNNYGGNGGGGNMNPMLQMQLKAQNMGMASSFNQGVPNIYKGELPGFIVMASGAIVEEMFGR
jgi:hypothetical protein